MESPAYLINKIISLSLLDPRIEAIVLTGSRGREHDIDSYSDIDIELIGHGASTLFHDKNWVSLVAKPLVALHLINGGENEPEDPTCLVIYEEGRKVDFTFAEPERLHKMKRNGLDATFSRGYTVLLDKTGITDGLPSLPNIVSLLPIPLSQEQFSRLVSDFWLEAHQVSIALTRHELWVAWSRSADMKQYLLTVLEQLVSAKSEGTQNTWYNGRHYQEWMPEPYISSLTTIFDCSTPPKAAQSLYCLMNCFTQAISELALIQNYSLDKHVNEAMTDLVVNLLQNNQLLPEIPL